MVQSLSQTLIIGRLFSYNLCKEMVVYTCLCCSIQGSGL
uniref:Uncharacterized protein n=1 Tax=Rhizophora mucronata TaxID=61149 RepID=A0A2P2N9F2_RHIMU